MKLDADTVRALLMPSMVLDYYAIARRGLTQLSVRVCPVCGQLRRGSVSIHAQTGAWRCFHCGARGGILDLVAGYADLDSKRDYQRVLGVAAAIAGVPRGVPDEDHVRLLEEHRARRQAYAEKEARRQAKARAAMPFIWKNLDQRSVAGEIYLRGRLIDPDLLRKGDLVRYSKKGDPAVLLRDLATGEVSGIQYRCLQGDAKLLSEPGSQVAGACLLGRIADLDHAHVAILVEGLADTLVARLSWPDAVIFGAPGAGQLESIAKVIAPEVAKRQGILLIVPDDDPPGIGGSAHAAVAAMKSGLDLVERVRRDDVSKACLVDLGRNLAGVFHHDLAQAWATSRWRWHWGESLVGLQEGVD